MPLSYPKRITDKRRICLKAIYDPYQFDPELERKLAALTDDGTGLIFYFRAMNSIPADPADRGYRPWRDPVFRDVERLLRISHSFNPHPCSEE
jgi:hypothetical protein